MAWQLVREVLDHAPPMTPAERLILAAIGEAMPVNRRDGWDVESRHLVRRTGLDARGLRSALRRLTDRGLEVRVAVGTDGKGRRLYALPGKSTRYRLPEFPAPDGCSCIGCENPQVSEGGTVVPPTNGGGTTGSAPDPTSSGADPVGSAPDLTGSAADPVVPPTTSGTKPGRWRRPAPLPGSLVEQERAKRAEAAKAKGQCPTHLTTLTSRGECTGCKVDRMVGAA